MIDTSVIIRIEREDSSLNEFFASFEGEEAAISAITASELLVGVYRAASESRRKRRESFTEYVLGGLSVLAFDLAVARTHSRLWAELTTAGNMIGLHDLMIAATAVTNGLSVLTYNLREFSKVPGLDVRPQA